MSEDPKVGIPDKIIELQKLINEMLKDKLEPGEVIVLSTFIKGGLHFWIYPKTANLDFVEKLLGSCAVHIKQVAIATKARLEEERIQKLREIYVV